jgi:ATP adenylyltransferase
MERLYAPWRGAYIDKKEKKECIFCLCARSQDDEKNFIVKRFETGMIMLNLYPYNAGHLLAIPYAHERQLSGLSLAERTELIEMVTSTASVLSIALHCDGINIGMNLEKAAGGSIPEHLHMHIVPRWLGDTNFLVTVADTKAISFDLCEIYRKLKAAFTA